MYLLNRSISIIENFVGFKFYNKSQGIVKQKD